MKINDISYLLFDVDGVLSDGKIVYSNTGDEMKQFDVKDGMGLRLAKQGGLKLGIITARESNIVFKRATELRFDDLFMNQSDKTISYQLIKKKYMIEDRNIAFIGDDLFDLAILKQCGFSACPNDATEFVKNHVSLVLEKNGGYGAVREFVEYILLKQEKLAGLQESYLAGNK